MFWSWLFATRRHRTAGRQPGRVLRPEVLEDRSLPATFVPGFTETTFASGLAIPTAMEFAPDGRLFVTEKNGTVRIVQNGQLLPTPFASVSVNNVGERGLNGIALDPNFATNRFVYIYYTTNATTPVNRLSRITASTGNPNVAVANSEVVLLDNIASPNSNHNGGGLHFGLDGMLYLGVGEAGVPSNSQTLSNVSGKVLRLKTAPGDIIPADNPFVNTPGARGEIFALGFRNPFTFNVDPVTGRIFINDVGGTSFEEINELAKGGNFGWPTVEGFGNNPAFVNPVHAYAHNGQGAAITGGVFSRNTPFPGAFRGGYFFADFVQSFIRYLPAGSSQSVEFATNANNPTDLDIGPDGRLYYLSITGVVKRVDVSSNFPPRISSSSVGGQVRVFDASSGALQREFSPYGGYQGGLRVAMGDVNGDGFADIITAPGPGASGHVKVFDGVSLAELSSFFAYDPANTVGLQLAAGDLNDDGFAEVITGVDGGGPHVRAFDIRAGGAMLRNFFAFDPGYLGGVRVSAGDTDGDGDDDIIVAAGVGGNGHVKVFNGQTLAELASFFAFPGATLRQGVWVGAGDVDRDGRAEILIAAGAGELPHVKAFGVNGGVTTKASFYAFGGFTGGVRVSAVDADSDGDDDIVVGTATVVSHVKVFDAQSLAELRSFLAFDAPGVFVAGG